MNRLTPEEVEAIVRATARQRAVAYGSGQTVDSLAHALNISPAQVEDHLRDIRNGSVFTDREAFRRAMLGMGAATAVLVVLVVGSLIFGSRSGPAEAATTGSAPAVTGAPMPVASAASPVQGAAPASRVSPVSQGSGQPASSGLSEGQVNPPSAHIVTTPVTRRRMVGEAADKATEQPEVALQHD